jgi:hypothetical protein
MEEKNSTATLKLCNYQVIYNLHLYMQAYRQAMQGGTTIKMVSLYSGNFTLR